MKARFLGYAACCAVAACVAPIGSPARSQVANPAAALDGIWELVSLIEDGRLVSNDTVHRTLLRDGRITVRGQVLMYSTADGQSRVMPFITNPAANPKTVDLIGAQRVGGKGIYMLDGDNLILCVREAGADGRPQQFVSMPGQDTMLFTFRRAAPAADAPPANLSPPQPPAAPAGPTDADLRAGLIGRWGHQTESEVQRTTVNADGTFASTTTFKRGFKKLFDVEERTSGTWRVDGGTVTYTVSASTERGRVGQVYSLRILSLLPGELIYIDNQTGGRRIEWKIQ